MQSGGAIISNLLTPNRSSCKLTADLLWGSGSTDLMADKKKMKGRCHSKPLRSKPIIDLDDDFEADFQGFKDYFDEDGEIDVKPSAFSANKNSGVQGFVAALAAVLLLLLCAGAGAATADLPVVPLLLLLNASASAVGLPLDPPAPAAAHRL